MRRTCRSERLTPWRSCSPRSTESVARLDREAIELLLLPGYRKEIVRGRHEDVPIAESFTKESACSLPYHRKKNLAGSAASQVMCRGSVPSRRRRRKASRHSRTSKPSMRRRIPLASRRRCSQSRMTRGSRRHPEDLYNEPSRRRRTWHSATFSSTTPASL